MAQEPKSDAGTPSAPAAEPAIATAAEAGGGEFSPMDKGPTSSTQSRGVGGRGRALSLGR